MKLLKGYKPKSNLFAEYPYKSIALHIWRDDKKLEVWVPYTDYSKYPTVEIGEKVWNETTQNIYLQVKV